MPSPKVPSVVAGLCEAPEPSQQCRVRMVKGEVQESSLPNEGDVHQICGRRGLGSTVGRSILMTQTSSMLTSTPLHRRNPSCQSNYLSHVVCKHSTNVEDSSYH